MRTVQGEPDYSEEEEDEEGIVNSDDEDWFQWRPLTMNVQTLPCCNHYQYQCQGTTSHCSDEFSTLSLTPELIIYIGKPLVISSDCWLWYNRIESGLINCICHQVASMICRRSWFALLNFFMIWGNKLTNYDLSIKTYGLWSGKVWTKSKS